MRIKSKIGFTLIETLLAVAILGIISTVAISLVTINKVPISLMNENYELKAQMKEGTDSVIKTVREATAIFTHKDVDPVFTSNIFPEFSGDSFEITDSFINSLTVSNRDQLKAGIEKYKGWNFIVLSADKKELRNFIYHKDADDEENGYYTMEIIMEAKKDAGGLDIVYEMVFGKEKNNTPDNPGSDSLEFTLIGKTMDGANVSEKVETNYTIKALSSLQVVDRGDYTKAASVLFYRVEERPMGVDIEVAVAMILDVSGSMDNNLAGGTGGDINSANPKRIAILKDEAKELVKKLSNLGLANITIIPFSDAANGYSDWMNIKDNKSHITNKIDSLSAKGGTNVGDGIRRAYYQFDKFNKMPPLINEDGEEMLKKDAPKYMILLMDGVPTFGSVYYYSGSYKNVDYVTDDVDIDINYWYGASSSSYATKLNTGYYYEWVSNYYGSKTLSSKSTKSNDSVGFFAGNGSQSDALSKGYITEISKKLDNIVDSDNKKNIRLFIIGFSNVASDRTELKFIQDQLKNHVRSVSLTEVIDKTGLKKVFYDINHIILEDYWAITGPKE